MIQFSLHNQPKSAMQCYSVTVHSMQFSLCIVQFAVFSTQSAVRPSPHILYRLLDCYKLLSTGLLPITAKVNFVITHHLLIHLLFHIRILLPAHAQPPAGLYLLVLKTSKYFSFWWVTKKPVTPKIITITIINICIDQNYIYIFKIPLCITNLV